MDYWVLNYNIDKAKKQFAQAKLMMRSFEHWFGKYPFYEDSYKLIETPFLGMEHQSGVAYGNKYENGYLGNDLSGTGWGLKWDFIIVHESGHEWFGNNITSKDLGDMWIHEGFTNYSETLFTETYYGKEAANEYNHGTRKKIKNEGTIIGPYGVNEEGSGDMYSKGGNLLHLIRHSINNDELFRKILIGLNTKFYHATVTTKQVEDYISTESNIDFSKVFDQYLRTTQIPVLEFHITSKGRTINYRWSNCINGFSLSLVLHNGDQSLRIKPTTEWKKLQLNASQKGQWSPSAIEKDYYIKLNEKRKNKSKKD
jgi:aminopeptidase N